MQQGGIARQHIPATVQYVRRRRNAVHAVGQSGGQRSDKVFAVFGIGALGQLEQVMAFGPRQAKHRSQSGQDAGRYGHIAPLLYPGVPGNADAAQLGQLFRSEETTSELPSLMRTPY